MNLYGPVSVYACAFHSSLHTYILTHVQKLSTKYNYMEGRCNIEIYIYLSINSSYLSQKLQDIYNLLIFRYFTLQIITRYIELVTNMNKCFSTHVIFWFKILKYYGNNGKMILLQNHLWSEEESRIPKVSVSRAMWLIQHQRKHTASSFMNSHEGDETLWKAS